MNNESPTMLIKDITIIEKEMNQTIIELINYLKKFSPYEILCHIVSLMKSTIVLQNIETEADVDSHNIEMKYAVEIVQMLLTCIKEPEFENNVFTEENLGKIISLTETLFSLEMAYTFNIGINNNDDETVRNYKAEDIMKINITGKRYDIFEINHHKKILGPHKEEIENTYRVKIENIYDGITNLKHQFNFGLDESSNKIKNIMDSIDLENPTDEQLKIYDEFIGNAFKLDCHDVTKNTNWPEKFIEIFSTNLGDNEKFIENITPKDFFELHNLINRKPIIKIEDSYYVPILHRLLDSFDKNIFKDIYIKNESRKEKIKKEIANSCEIYTGELFKNIIPTAKIQISNYYKVNKNFIENDILIEYDKYLFVIEVKAGSFTPDVAVANFDSHKVALNTLIEKGNSQIVRFMNELETKKDIQIYDNNNKNAKVKVEININNYKEIFKFVITLDGFNEIEARAEKIGIINLQKNIVICSIDDLETYSDYFKNNPTEFIHYIRNRTLATNHPLIDLNDELDHLGLYIEHNSYVTTANNLAKKYKDVKNIIWELPRLELDKYYNGKYFGKIVEKPIQNHPKYIKELISYSNSHSTKNLTSTIMTILDMSTEGQEEVEYYINEMIKFYHINRRPKHAAIAIENQLIVISCIVDNDNYNTKNLQLEMYANLKISGFENAYTLILFYNGSDILKKVETKNMTSSDYEYFTAEVDSLVKKIKERRVGKIKSERKIGRNEKCPCGSGKKYKKCCGK